MNNVSHRRTAIAGVLIALFIVLGVWLAQRGATSNDATRIGATKTQAGLPRVTAALPHDARRVVRAQVVEGGKSPLAARVNGNVTEAPGGGKLTKPVAASPSAANQRKSPEQVIASFVEDDPTQVFLPDTVRYHAAVQSEQVDPDWGPATQSALQNYLASQLGHDVDLLAADCRTDLCELQLVESTNNTDTAFRDAMRQLHQQPWWQSLQLDQETEVATWEDGRLVVIHYFSRR